MYTKSRIIQLLSHPPGIFVSKKMCIVALFFPVATVLSCDY